MTMGKYKNRSVENLFRPKLSGFSFMPRRDPFWVKCHGCQTDMLIDSIPAMINGFAGHRMTFYPCPAAPYVCPACREDREKMTPARKAMVEHFHDCKRVQTVQPVASVQDVQIVGRSIGMEATL